MKECRTCKKKLDAHTGIRTESEPEEGDISICAYCGTISRFDVIGDLVPLTEEELELIKSEDYESWEAAQTASRLIKELRKHVN